MSTGVQRAVPAHLVWGAFTRLFSFRLNWGLSTDQLRAVCNSQTTSQQCLVTGRLHDIPAPAVRPTRFGCCRPQPAGPHSRPRGPPHGVLPARLPDLSRSRRAAGRGHSARGCAAVCCSSWRQRVMLGSGAAQPPSVLCWQQATTAGGTAIDVLSRTVCACPVS